jgi:hypothetical protein
VGRTFTFWCATCALELDDGVDYTACPRCDGPIEWVDRAPRAQVTVPSPARVSHVLLGVLLVAQAVFAIADPHGFAYLRPLLVIAWFAAIPGTLLAVAFVPALAALLDERTRVIHGLEHATIAVLAERGIAVSHGVTLRGMFDLALPNDGRSWERAPMIRNAALAAIRRVKKGERALAYTDRCGTSYAVGFLMMCLAVSAAGAVAFAYGVPHGYTFAATVAALLAARAAARPLGRLAQRLLTVSTRSASATVGAIEHEVSPDGAFVYYAVHVAVAPAPPGAMAGEPI